MEEIPTPGKEVAEEITKPEKTVPEKRVPKEIEEPELVPLEKEIIEEIPETSEIEISPKKRFSPIPWAIVFLILLAIVITYFTNPQIFQSFFSFFRPEQPEYVEAEVQEQEPSPIMEQPEEEIPPVVIDTIKERAGEAPTEKVVEKPTTELSKGLSAADLLFLQDRVNSGKQRLRSAIFFTSILPKNAYLDFLSITDSVASFQVYSKDRVTLATLRLNLKNQYDLTNPDYISGKSPRILPDYKYQAAFILNIKLNQLVSELKELRVVSFDSSLTMFNQIAKELELSVLSIKTYPPVETTPFRRLLFEIQVTGSFDNLLGYIDEIYKIVQNFEISKILLYHPRIARTSESNLILTLFVIHLEGAI
jgi:hypothetical protein